MTAGLASKASSFDKDVFINCPFDELYFALLRPLLFTVIALGFEPRIALETSNSAENRLEKICGIIKQSKFSIHDLSRLKAAAADEFYRLNMPFELGIDYGTRLVGSTKFKQKRFLILGKEPYDYQKALSDLSGVDIKSHGNDPQQIVTAVRNWFVETAGVVGAPSPQRFWYAFNDFAADFYATRKKEGFTDEDLNIMPIPEYVHFIHTWVENYPVKHAGAAVPKKRR